MLAKYDERFVRNLEINAFLSQKYRLLYISTPKVACTSLKWWLASLEGCAEALRAVTESGESDPDLSIHDNFHKIAPHVTGLDLNGLSEALSSDAFFRFAVVRNPFKRIFSAWQSKLLLREPYQIGPYTKLEFFHHQIRHGKDITTAFEGFLEHLANNEAPTFWDHHWTPQITLLRPDLIDYTRLTKIEHTGELSSALQEWLGPYAPDPFSLRRVNESLIPYIPNFISDRSAELIRILYAEDFDTFGYQRQIPSSPRDFSAEQLEVAIKAIQLIRARHERLGDRAAQIQRLNQTIADREGQIAGFSGEISQRNEQIAGLHQVAAQREDQVAGEISRLNEQIAGLNRAVAQRDDQIATRDDRIVGLNQTIAQRDDRIVGLNQTIALRDEEISNLDKSVSQRDQEIAHLHDVTAQRYGQIANLNEALGSSERQIEQLANDAAIMQAEKDRQIYALQRELTKFLNTRSWRATAPLRRIAELYRHSLTRSIEFLKVRRELLFGSATRQVRASALFDADYYLEAYPDVRNAGVDPAIHYLIHGWKERRNPSTAFDTGAYLSAHPDVARAGLNPLIHYLRHGQNEGRPIMPGVAPAVDDPVKVILASKYFDAAYYSEVAKLSFESRTAAVEHYISVGEKANYKPSSRFDPFVYRISYPDLADYGAPLLVHYISHGRSEGRTGLFEVDYSNGEQPFARDRTTILVAVHELSKTGAPILALNLIKHLGRDNNIVCIAVQNAGPLQASFLTHVHKLLTIRAAGQFSAALISPTIRTLKERFGIDVSLVNSAESVVIAEACYLNNIPVVSLVHEFAAYLSQKKMASIVESSQRVVFSSSLTEGSFRAADVFRGGFSNATIIPQGKSDVPSAPGNEAPLLKEVLQKVADEKRFLVIGCGHVQIRKGVDLFISAASHVANALGRRSVYFLWIGDGYAPDVAGDYSLWLKDQVARAGVEDVVRFIPGVGGADLERVYRRADVMFLSSRLDPFPNVAIDAVCAGLPIVCFEKASGIAEYLKDIGSTRSLVVPYLDVRAAADAIIGLKEDPQARESIVPRLIELANRYFDFDSYSRAIQSQLQQAIDANTQEDEDTKTIVASEFFQDDFLARSDAKAASRSENIRQYVRLSAAGTIYPVPRPLAGLSPEMYAAAAKPLTHANAFAQWLRDGRPEGPWLREVLELRGAPRKSDLRIALHIHLHYADMAGDILHRLQANKTTPDLFLTVTRDEAVSQISSLLNGYAGKVEIIEVQNRGRDIGSMLTVLSCDLQKYDLVGHLHAKKSPHYETNSGISPVAKWRDFLYENLVGGIVPALDLIATCFETRQDLGLVFPDDPFICGWGRNWESAQALAERLKLKAGLPGPIEFPVGNMFIARPDAIRPLFNANFALEEFPVEPLPIDGTMLHAIERMMALVCESEGYAWQTTLVPGVTRLHH